jgi:hypothetical protein
MITKEKIDARIDEIKRELSGVYNNLERVWDAARAGDLGKVMNEVDSLQNLGRNSISGAKSKLDLLNDDLYELIEQQEKTKDLPKLLDFQMAFDQIQSTVKRWDKQLHPEK